MLLLQLCLFCLSFFLFQSLCVYIYVCVCSLVFRRFSFCFVLFFCCCLVVIIMNILTASPPPPPPIPMKGNVHMYAMLSCTISSFSHSSLCAVYLLLLMNCLTLNESLAGKSYDFTQVTLSHQHMWWLVSAGCDVMGNTCICSFCQGSQRNSPQWGTAD